VAFFFLLVDQVLLRVGIVFHPPTIDAPSRD
jgi:hypothetical protein